MAFIVEPNKPLNPVHLRILRPNAVMLEPNLIPHPVRRRGAEARGTKGVMTFEFRVAIKILLRHINDKVSMKSNFIPCRRNVLRFLGCLF